MPDYEHHSVDVLIIGAGGAGLRAAVEASSMGARILPNRGSGWKRGSRRVGNRSPRGAAYFSLFSRFSSSTRIFSRMGTSSPR